MKAYFGGGHSRLRDQVLVDAGACDGSFAAIGRQNTSSGKPCREGCAGVLLGNLLDYQHFRHHLFTTRRVFCDVNKKKGIKPVNCACNLTLVNLDLDLPHTPACGATARN